jgi:hypothetical protein
MIGFGFLEDERVQREIDWQARSVTGEGFTHYPRDAQRVILFQERGDMLK